MRLLPFLFAFTAGVLALSASAFGQAAPSPALVAEITRLEQLEARSVNKGDTAMLFWLWSPSFVVNNPDNQVVTAAQVRAFIRSGKIDYTTFKRNIEKITIANNVAIAMGHEVITPQKQTANAGKTVTRRYTDVWVRTAGVWHLTARQATNVLVQ